MDLVCILRPRMMFQKIGQYVGTDALDPTTGQLLQKAERPWRRSIYYNYHEV